jgi:hypothetical protein
MDGSDRIGEDERRRSGRNRDATTFLRWRHGRRWLSCATEHYLTKEKHQWVEHTNANSPRARTKPMRNREKLAAWRGGRQRRDRAPSSRWHLGSSANAAKGLDGGGCAQHPWFYSPKAIQVRKREIGRRIWRRRFLEREIRRRRCIEEEGDPDNRVRGVSDGEGRKARARAGGLLGSAQAETWGEEKRWAAHGRSGRGALPLS